MIANGVSLSTRGRQRGPDSVDVSETNTLLACDSLACGSSVFVQGLREVLETKRRV